MSASIRVCAGPNADLSVADLTSRRCPLATTRLDGRTITPRANLAALALSGHGSVKSTCIVLKHCRESKPEASRIAHKRHYLLSRSVDQNETAASEAAAWWTGNKHAREQQRDRMP